MVNNFDELNELHIDVLQEIGNIGLGNAATSLGMMLNEEVNIQLPKVKFVDFNDAINIFGGPELMSVGVLIKFMGEASGMIMFLMSKEDANHISDVLLGGSESDELDEMKLSVIKEIGNILSSAYVNAISTLTNLVIDISIPYVAIDMAGAILSVPMIEFGAIGDKVLFIEEGFYTDSKQIRSNVIMFPELETLNVIMQRLGIA